MTNVKIWISAFRLRTLPLATASIAIGSFLAAAENSFQWRVAILGFLTAVLLQILSNLANDYGDTVHGADGVERRGPVRAVQTGTITRSQIKLALLIFVALCLLVGYLLIRNENLIFHLSGLAAIAAAVAYTLGPRPYGYAGLGDLFVFLFFGVVGVFGIYYLHTHQVNWQILMPAAACGLFCVGVLNINNIRDIDSDKLAGKNTIPVRLGETKAKIYHWTLLISALGITLLFILANLRSAWQFLFLLTVPLILQNAIGISIRTEAASLDPYLKQMVITTLLFSLCFGLGLLL
ncbi:MAG: 1,4-dihydroxy-2-naphthoate polyprenyltransferase [bacterium]